MSFHAAFLRGVNVGGKNKVAMKALAALFEAAGCADVSTYIQSGNVVFRASPAVARRVPAAVSAAIARELGLSVPIVVRTGAELAGVVAHNPFPDALTVPKALYVYFLADPPDPARLRALDPDRSPGDRFAVRGREVYVAYAVGMGKTRLTNDWLDRSLATVSTARNWNTVAELARRTAGT